MIRPGGDASISFLFKLLRSQDIVQLDGKGFHWAILSTAHCAGLCVEDYEDEEAVKAGLSTTLQDVLGHPSLTCRLHPL